MAAQPAYQLSPPIPFDFAQPNEWTKWIRRFERFRVASGLSKKAEEDQVHTLVYSMGDQADDILLSFRLTEEEKNDYSLVKGKFDSHFVARRNVIFERAKFNLRKQEANETVETFLTALHCLVEHCEYGQLKDEMIRDRLVVGLKDSKLAEALQLDPDLTLQKAVSRARQSEAVRNQQEVIRGSEPSKSSSDLNIDAVHRRQPGIQRFQKKVVKNYPTQKGKPQLQASSCHEKGDVCTRCGKIPRHSQKVCPARFATCYNCSMKGHYSKWCNTKEKNHVRVIDSQEKEELFLGKIEKIASTDQWQADVLLNGRAVSFQIDTGADVTCISEKEFSRCMDLRAKLEQPDKKLLGPGRKVLDVTGKIRCRLTYGKETYEGDVYVLKALQRPLLGRPAIEALHLIVRVNATNSEGPPEDCFPELFSGLGKLQKNYKYKIQLKGGVVPYAVTHPRRVPIPLQQQVKEELDRMVAMGVISKVEEPTEWCAGMVVVPKPLGGVRICVDLSNLNEGVKRERFILPTVEQTLGKLGKARIFSKLDSNSGFWQIPLDQESSLLTTFITPQGRFCFNRLPFGITSAPEIYQRIMSQILEGITGVAGQTDDTLVCGETVQEHDTRLTEVLQRIKDAGLTLNKSKCKFRTTEIEFLGHKLDENGVHPSDTKVEAVTKMPRPTNVTETRRFLGLVHYLGKFVPHLADKSKPINDLLGKNSEWYWGDAQEKAFSEIKENLSTSPTLAMFDSQKPTKISADASSYGLGGVLMQLQDNDRWQPVAYASKTLTTTQCRYAQVEKEALAVAWACNKFEDYLLGSSFLVETDHKPLVQILGQKQLDELTPRLQRLRMKLMRFSYKVVHVPGKDLVLADTLSRAPTTGSDISDAWDQEMNLQIGYICNNLPMSKTLMEQVQEAQDQDEACKQLRSALEKHWPVAMKSLHEIKRFWSFKDEIWQSGELLLKGEQIIIPESLRSEMLERIHIGHLGIAKGKRRANASIWWPGMGSQITKFIENCETCCRQRKNPTEPLKPSELPDYPWQKVAVDLFEWAKSTYMVTVDYFSRYPVVTKLTGTTSSQIINHLKSIFTMMGIPEHVISDNGPQFSSEEFKIFAKTYEFTHTTSSPKFPQSNGLAERYVNIVKQLLARSQDPYIALLTYRTSPLEHGKSPAELLFGRRLRTTLPTTTKSLEPKAFNLKKFQQRDEAIKRAQKLHFDRRHRATPLEDLKVGEKVWIPATKQSGVVQGQTPYPRSYWVATPSGTLRRNRVHINRQQIQGERQGVPASEEAMGRATNGKETESGPPAATVLEEDVCATPSTTVHKTRSGRTTIPPKRLNL